MRKLKVTSFVLLCWVMSLQAQVTTHSPYSEYGLGLVEPTALGYNSAMGGVQYGSPYEAYINAANPASYGFVKKPTFSTGLAFRRSALVSDTATQSATTSYLKNIALAVPVAKWWTLSFGLLPYSKVNYSTSEITNVAELGEVQSSYTGQGNINRAFFGSGFNILKDSTHQLSVGFNASYLFGKLEREQNIIFLEDNDAFNTFNRKTYHVGDMMVEVGMMYSRELGKDTRLNLGVSYQIADSMRTVVTEYSSSYNGNIDAVSTVQDTINYSEDTSNIYLPQKVGAGVSLQLNNKWRLGADFSMQNWANMAIGNKNQGLRSTYEVAAGAQYIPNMDELSNLMKLIRYRFGFRYGQTPVQINQNSVNEYAVAAGIGIPVLRSYSTTTINFGIEVGQRGRETTGIFKEQFTNFNFGLSLTPHNYDRWFYQRKIN